MRTITNAEAVATLSHQISGMQPDDLAQVHNELFPSNLVTEEQVRARQEVILSKINDHIAKGLEMEEIVDLWNIIFPMSRHITYDDVSDSIQFRERPLEFVE